MKITQIHETKILASRGNETIKVALTLDIGISATALVPAGISAGKYEKRNVSPNEAIVEIENIKQDLLGRDWDQQTLDAFLESKNLGGNTSLSISATFWKATRVIGHTYTDLHFPQLLLLLFEGAKHGNPSLWMQEFTVIESSLQQAIADFRTMRTYLEENHIESTVGAEGGFSPNIFNDQAALDTITKVLPDKQIALDAASSFTGIGGINYHYILDHYPIASLEDPFSDEQWEEWKSFYQRYSSKILIVGDDLTVTNPERIQRAVDEKAINAVIIKPNQNGTISGTLKAVEVARKVGLKVIVSHRAEETSDDWIVDFALQVKADYVKFGGMDRGERVAKYNRLMELGMA